MISEKTNFEMEHSLLVCYDKLCNLYEHIFQSVGIMYVLETPIVHPSHYVNVSVRIKFSQKTSVFTLIIISSP